MKYLVLLCWCFAAQASPFLVSGKVNMDLSHCGFYLDDKPQVLTKTVKEADGVYCKVDLQAIPPGAHTARLSYVAADENGIVWAEGEKSSPFSFGVPSRPAAIPSINGLVQ